MDARRTNSARLRRRGLWAAGLLLLPLWLMPCAELSAQSNSATSAPQTRRELARAAYASGADAYRAGRYREAADYFEKADQFLPSAAYSYNVALANDKLGDVGGALQAYRSYLKRRVGASNAKEVLERIEVLELRLAQQGLRQLSVSSEPSGALVSIDGAAVGVTPWIGEIAEGRHRVRIILKGYSPVVRSVDLTSTRARDLDFRLARTRAEAELRPKPKANASSSRALYEL
jgi:tetratricopeptide (TPR) repeat protein